MLRGTHQETTMKQFVLRRGGAFLVGLVIRALLVPYVASALSSLRHLLGVG
jgi:hypothetical protein